MTRGIVIGKFYPPHHGHKYLIEAARSQCDELTIIVCDKKGQKIPGALRAEWMQEFSKNIIIKVVDDHLPEDDSKAWADYTKQTLGYSPDIVFTSEGYGDDYAKYLGARHVLVDKGRSKVPISATQIRKNPYDTWQYLGEGPRAYFAKRICLVGAESTGTTTMAVALAKYYDTEWVPEYGRIYYEKKMRSAVPEKWTTDEFVHIASRQNQDEDKLVRKCNKILICDTDSFATTIWHERYLGFRSPQVDKLSEGRKYDLYLLTDTDIPFVQDGTRDGENIRQKMHQTFEKELKLRGKPYKVLSGNHEDRFKNAIEECDKILRSGFSL